MASFRGFRDVAVRPLWLCALKEKAEDAVLPRALRISLQCEALYRKMRKRTVLREQVPPEVDFAGALERVWFLWFRCWYVRVTISLWNMWSSMWVLLGNAYLSNRSYVHVWQLELVDRQISPFELSIIALASVQREALYRKMRKRTVLREQVSREVAFVGTLEREWLLWFNVGMCD